MLRWEILGDCVEYRGGVLYVQKKHMYFQCVFFITVVFCDTLRYVYEKTRVNPKLYLKSFTSDKINKN